MYESAFWSRDGILLSCLTPSNPVYVDSTIVHHQQLTETDISWRLVQDCEVDTPKNEEPPQTLSLSTLCSTPISLALPTLTNTKQYVLVYLRKQTEKLKH